MTQRIYVDRSRYETYGRCPRSRYLQYSFAGTGIESSRKPLPLAVGSSVHAGLAEMLRYGQMLIDSPGSSTWELVEEKSVAAALADFAQYKTRIELPDAERLAAAAIVTNDVDKAAALWGTSVPSSDMDEYLYAEQSALVEAMVRAYARRRLRPLLEQFEVLEVEREGEWELSPQYSMDSGPAIWFMSRPDALLRERESNQLYLLSYKTAASWDIRKAKDAEHDMQGMSEGIEIERRLAEWWNKLHDWKEKYPDTPLYLPTADASKAMSKYLWSLDSPPRILAVRMEFMLKGERWKDKDLTLQFGVEMRSQKSHLIRFYEAVSTPAKGSAGFTIGSRCWSWDFIREDGRDSNLAWQNWRPRAAWEIPGGVKQWIDKLDDAAPTMSGEDSTMGLEPRLLGYKCDAQAVGVTREHPLDSIFIPPIHVYRNEDELRDMVEQMEAQERRVAEGVAAIHAAGDDAGDIRHELNVHFPQTRRACSYPTQCQFVPICYGGEDIRRDPLASGLYTIRNINHPQELEKEQS